MKNTPPSPPVGVLPRSNAATYRVHTPTFAILTLDYDRVPITIPVNAFIDVMEMKDDASEKTLVDIEWNTRALMMFAHDLQTRATIVRPRGRSLNEC